MVLNGQTAAFAHIIKNTERLVAQIVFKMISDPEDRKDLAQDIYIKVFHKLGSFQFQSKLSTWIAQVSYNTCLDHLRRKKINMEELREGKEEDRRFSSQYIQEGSIGSTDENLLRKDHMALLHQKMETLTPIQRTLISLYHEEEMSYEEIGQVTGLPAGTVKSYLFRARRSLREQLLPFFKKTSFVMVTDLLFLNFFI